MKDATEWFDDIVTPCKEQAAQKAEEYGSSWTIYRPLSLVDRLHSKAKRIRTIQETNDNQVGDSIESEFQAILNYGVMFLIQCNRGFEYEDLSSKSVLELYDKVLKDCKDLMKKKNHDYGEAWRDMSQVGITDEVLVKLIRSKQQINDSKTAKENIEDIVNYSIFSLIKIAEKAQ
jgi:hypothetical protein